MLELLNVPLCFAADLCNNDRIVSVYWLVPELVIVVGEIGIEDIETDLLTDMLAGNVAADGGFVCYCRVGIRDVCALAG